MKWIIPALLLLASPAARSQPTADPACVNVKIGDTRYYDCLNRQMEQAVPNRRFSTQDAPIGVQAPGPATGTFNQAATAEQLGSSFGNSVVPQRPVTNYSSALIRSR